MKINQIIQDASHLLINEDSTIQRGLEVIEQGEERICFVIDDNSKLINYLLDIGKNKITKTDENNSFKKLKLSLIEGGSPSIETFAHSLLNKYCIHLHPIGSNMLTVQKNSKLVINKLFKDEISNKQVYYIEYKTPGVSLAQAILKCIKGEYPIQNDCTFILENHGIISTSDDISKLIEMTERVANKIEKYLKLLLRH